MCLLALYIYFFKSSAYIPLKTYTWIATFPWEVVEYPWDEISCKPNGADFCINLLKGLWEGQRGSQTQWYDFLWRLQVGNPLVLPFAISFYHWANAPVSRFSTKTCKPKKIKHNLCHLWLLSICTSCKRCIFVLHAQRFRTTVGWHPSIYSFF